MELLADRFKRIGNLYTDIQYHYEMLYELARQVNHITEIGVRDGISTTALYYGLANSALKGKKILIGYDIDECPAHKIFVEYAKKKDLPQYVFHRADSRKIEIERTELLFIDSYHSYQQLKIELEKHSGQAVSLIVLHDTTKYGEYAEHGAPFRGLWPAVEEFVEQGMFYVKLKDEKQNGLTVLERHKTKLTVKRS